MKRGKVLMTVLVVLAVLFASCASHLGEDENAAASKAMKINFAMIIDNEAAQKAVALHGDTSDYKFFYKAAPQWKSASAIQGDTGGHYVEINSTYASMTTDNVSIGYFKPGLWKFDVVITSSDGTPETAEDGTKVLYRAKSSWSNAERSIFQNGTRTVNLPAAEMELAIDPEYAGAKATITIKVAVPKIKVDAAPDVTVTLGGGGPSPMGEVTVDASPDVNTKIEVTADYDSDPVSNANTTNWYYFEKTIGNIIPGNYDITLTYKDAASGNKVGGAIISTTLLPTAYTIWGTIENGEYQIATVTLNVPAITVDFKTDVDGDPETIETSVVAGGTMVCTPTPKRNVPTAGTYFMTWYVNGEAQEDIPAIVASDGTFTFGPNSTTSTDNPGTYEIVCKARKNDASNLVAYKSYTVTVTPAP